MVIDLEAAEASLPDSRQRGNDQEGSGNGGFDAAHGSVEYLAADIRDRDALLGLAGACRPRGAAPTEPWRPWVINLAARQYQAAIPRRGRQHWFSETNVAGAVNVCQLAAELGAAGLVQFSTDMVYGFPRAVPVTESHALNPIGEYGASKVRMEAEVRECAGECGLPLTIFRPRLISGRGRLGVFTRLFALLRNNRPLPLIGDGRNFYQMVAVEDCAAAVLCALDKGCPDAVYNLGSNPTLCVRDLMTALRDRVRSKSRILPTPAALVKGTLRALSVLGIEPLYREQYALADQNFIVSIERAKTELGWRPRRDDLELLVAAYDYWAGLP